MPVFRLTSELTFPPPHLAIREGLLAVGGDLSIDRLALAYGQGIFPWYAEDDPILWWSPDPRLVLFPHELHVSRSLRRLINKGRLSFTLDRAFGEVIRGCAAARGENHPGTWIVPEMISAYERLYGAGLAHSVEAWRGDELAGGLYGVSLGRTFYGESMFTRVSNASKAALVVLVQHLQQTGFDLIDCQVTTPHLKQFGAREIPRAHFLRTLRRSLRQRTLRGRWDFIPGGGIRLA
ncbi:MAG: leucyl/phenylalanyl-tRNA--protein transferase [Desulfobacterales bacterium]|nr:leucyl/phenylalanyl-tRNA--protein transferase [Desulfobacterales bacterium]